MRTADHMNLSRYIMDHMDAGASKLKKAAFIFGSIEPDINMLTYFRGSIHGEEKLRGHNYENVQKYMEKLKNPEMILRVNGKIHVLPIPEAPKPIEKHGEER